MNELCERGHRPRLEWDGSPRVKTRIDLADALEATALEMLRLHRLLRSDGIVRFEDTYHLTQEVHQVATTLEAFDFSVATTTD